MNFPVLMPRAPTTRRSGSIFHWRASDLSLTPLTNQVPTFTRAGTNTSPDDSAGASYTAVYSQPAWHWDPGLEVPTLRMGSSPGDELYWALNLLPREMSVYFAFIEQGTVSVDQARLWQIGHQTNGGVLPHLRIASNGTFYTLVNYPPSNPLIAAPLAVAPSNGDAVEIRGVLNADGSILIGQSINGGAETTASNATTETLPAAWAGPYLHLNGVAAANQGDADFRAVKIAPGIRTMAEMRTAF